MFSIVTLVGLGLTILTAIPVILQLRSHPRGLPILFFTEMWERFSYYGMRGLLVVYMTQHFLFEDSFASGQYGAFISLALLLPLIGGMLADRYLGTRKAVGFGALLLVAGHFMMAVEQPPAQEQLIYEGREYAFVSEGQQNQYRVAIAVDGAQYEIGPGPNGGITIEGLPATASLPSVLDGEEFERVVTGRDPFYVSTFYIALSLIALGIGFLKSNITTIVGQLYPQGDPRRDGGFTLYYFGINIGALWATILCSALALEFGWWAGFGLAGLGMLAGYIVFRFGKPLLEGKGEPPNPERLKRPILGPLNQETLIYALVLLSVPLIWLMVQREAVVNWLLVGAAVVVLIYFFHYILTKATRVEAHRLLLAFILICGSTAFWTCFSLGGTALNQFAERNTQLPSDGFLTVTSSQLQGLGSAYLLILAPIIAGIWTTLARRNREPNDPLKFGLAIMQVGLGFLLLVWGAQFADADYKVPLIFLAGLYLFLTMGELLLSPVGLSAMTKLAPPVLMATVMATWFLGGSASYALSAQIAKLTAAETFAGAVLDPAQALQTYVTTFQNVGWGAFALGAALALASPWLGKLAHKGE
jgi:POT family proton-dependent oligopeptide transporter